jgi:K+-sensing histidine kinase KdpD
MKSTVVLGYSLFSFILWFICQGKIYSGHYDGYWLGLTFPVRMFILSLIILLLAYVHSSKIKLSEKVNFCVSDERFSKVYYAVGLLLMFIPVWIASLGGFIQKPLFDIKTEILLFVLLSIVIAVCLIYIGIIKSDKSTLNFGLAFVILEVYGKLYEFLLTRPGNVIFYIIVIIVAFGTAVIVEYIQKHKEQIKLELIKGAIKA